MCRFPRREEKQWAETVAQGQSRRQTFPRGVRRSDPVQDQHNPTVLFNGMNRPDCALRDSRCALGTQGESITPPNGTVPYLERDADHRWRKLWGAISHSFFFCSAGGTQGQEQYAIRARGAGPGADVAEHRMAVTIDIGDPDNVHPKDKQDVAPGSSGSPWPKFMAATSSFRDRFTSRCRSRVMRSA